MSRRKRALSTAPKTKKKQKTEDVKSRAVMLNFVRKTKPEEENIIVLTDDEPCNSAKRLSGDMSSLPSPGSLQSLPIHVEETLMEEYDDTVEPSDAAVVGALILLCNTILLPEGTSTQDLVYLITQPSIPVIFPYERVHSLITAAVCLYVTTVVTQPKVVVLDADMQKMCTVHKDGEEIVELNVINGDMGKVKGAGGYGRLMMAQARNAEKPWERYLVVLNGGWGVGGYTECRSGTDINIIAHQQRIPTMRLTDPTSPYNGTVAITLSDKQPVLLVQHPSILISATEISDALQCSRKPYLSRKSRSSWSKMSLPALSGTIVHGVVQECIEKGSVNDGLVRSLIKKYIALSAVELHTAHQTDISAASLIEPFIPTIKHCVVALKASCMEDTSAQPSKRISATRLVEAEKRVSCEYHGLKGIVDAQVLVDIEDTVRPAAMELKTLQHLPQRGRTVLRTHHKAQLLVYLLLLKMEGKPVTDGILAYLAKGCSHARIVSVEREVLWMETAHIIRVRNALAVHLHFQELPQPDFTQLRTCKICSHAEACLSLASIHNERPPSRILDFIEAVQPGMVKEDTEIMRRESTLSEVGGFDSQGSMSMGDSQERRKHTESNWDQLAKSEKEVEFLKKWDKWIGLEENGKSNTLLAKQRGNVVSLYSQVKNERLRSLVVNLEAPVFKPSKVGLEVPIGMSLNEQQKTAIQRALACEDYSIIQGLPGTGKTTTIAVLVWILATMGRKILVASGTNSAVDTICLKLKEIGIHFVRLTAAGKEGDTHPALAHNVFPAKFESIEGVGTVLKGCSVVAATAHNLHHAVIKGGMFDHVVVDEAGQMLLPVCVGALLCAKQFTLVGDHEQLPPIVRSDEAVAEGAAVSLLERLTLAHPKAVTTLTLQYRMNSEIAAIPNLVMYNGRLEMGCDAVANGRLKGLTIESGLPEWLQLSLQMDQPLVFVDCSDISEKGDAQNVSIVEAKMALSIAKRLEPHGTVGIISPFRPQVELLKSYLDTNTTTEVLTVDQAQGKDLDSVIITLAKCAGDKVGPLIRSPNRLNVAFTRARKKQVCLGCFTSVFDDLPEWSAILSYVKAKGLMVKPSSY